MPYIEKTFYCNGIIEKKKCYSGRQGIKGLPRDTNHTHTPEDVQKVNNNRAEMKLRHLLFCNFRPGDWHAVLTYRKKSKPGSDEVKRPTPDEAKQRLRAFIAELRVYFREVLHQELVYIHATEYEATAIHHHIVLPGVDIRPLCKMWKKNGTLRPTAIRNVQHLANLAHYLVKETKGRLDKNGRHVRRWIGSTNLKKPRVSWRKVKANSWQKLPRPGKGYHLDKTVGAGAGVEVYANDKTGTPVQFFRLVPDDYDEWDDEDGPDDLLGYIGEILPHEEGLK